MISPDTSDAVDVIVPVSHVIFDCDGLILDTEAIYSQVVGELCEKYDKKFTWDIKVKQMGRTELESGQVLIDCLNLPITAEEYAQMTMIGYEKLFPSSKLLPGAEKLIRHLHAHNIPIAVATGGSEVKYNLKITEHKELFSLFSHIVFASDDSEVRNSKPCPDVFLVCAKRFTSDNEPVSSSKVLVFEDAPNGVEAAYAAGMHCVWVPDTRADRTGIQDKAVQVLSTLEHFKPEHFGLPAYSSSI